ncbi:MAG: tRNA 4-thiouridine(8) synthase ThiI, partial [Calditrichaeota bacterium]
GLKGENRRQFEDQLIRNLRQALKGVLNEPVKRAYGRFLIYLPEEFDWPAIRERLEKVPGLANFSLAELVEQNIEAIEASACRQMQQREFPSFRVTTKRSQKNFPMTSDEINRRVGAAIQQITGAKVDLTHPAVTCYIEVFDQHAVVYTEKIPGLRGLPVGSSEKAVSLLSSGIDSPVASYRIITRGVRLIFVHFHSVPFTSPASMENAKRLVARLTEYQLSSRLYCVPFLEIQQAIMAATRPDYRVVLYRRSMVRIAERIARRERARALVTGESIGQVASQTLSNMRVINEVATLPILRPLSGSDKEEIIAQAWRIGTFEISTEPYDDCCSLFVPKHPVTRAEPEIVHDIESELDWKALEQKALQEAEIHRFIFPPGDAPAD